MQVPFLDLLWQHEQIKDALAVRFDAIFAKTAFVLGPDVEVFEKNFAAYLDVNYAIGVASGTDALVLALRALNIGEGDEVIIVDTSFIASASAVLHVGARPVFVDINLETRNADAGKLEAAITSKTRALMPVHLYGAAADMDTVLALAKKHDLFVIEDACQAHGATYRGKKLGTLGDISAFSFYPGKNLGAYGEGGAVVTNSEEHALKIKKLRNHGGILKYEHELLGYNSRLHTLQAAVLDEKLTRLDSWNAMRRAIATRYNDAFKDVPLHTLTPLPESVPVEHLYVVEVLEGTREAFMAHMKEKEIGVGIHYPKPLHLLPALSFLGYRKGDFPVAEDFSERIISLPMFPGMSEAQVAYIIETVRGYFQK